MSKRIARLTDRFQTPVKEDEPTPATQLKPYTLYFASDTRHKLDRAFKDVQHQLYPTDFRRNEFYTALLEVGLQHLDEVAQTIREVVPPKAESGS